MTADRITYLSDTVRAMMAQWPDNRTITIVCHGHSVPAGYFATPVVDTMHAYPHLLHRGLKERFPFAIVNVIVTAIGGERSDAGAARFDSDVLSHKPDLVTIDYGLNDRNIGLEPARAAWTSMIAQAREQDVKLLLLTPTFDVDEGTLKNNTMLAQHAAQIRELATVHDVGCVDSYAAFHTYCKNGGDVSDLLSWRNHPNLQGHALVATELLRWFPIP